MTDDSGRTPEQMVKIIERLSNRHLRNHWKLFLYEGLFLMIIGVAAVIMPKIATLASDIMIGWVLLAIGIAGIAHRLTTSTAPGFWPGLLFSVLTLLLGAVVAFVPSQGIITLSMILVAYLVAHAAYMILLSISIEGSWQDVLGFILSSLIDFLLIALILSDWPEATNWILGLFIGISLLFAGAGTLLAALAARSNNDTGQTL